MDPRNRTIRFFGTAKIYALMSGQLALYVGSTIRSLTAREINHRSVSNTTASRHIPKDLDWEMILLDSIENYTLNEIAEKEQDWLDKLKPLYNSKKSFSRGPKSGQA